MIKGLRTALLGCLAVILIQCSPIEATKLPEKQAASATPVQLEVISDTQMTPTVLSPADPGLQSLIDHAKEDLAQRLTISISHINLVEAKEVVWPDASLGCPQPGMKYKQVPEDGAQIILQVEGINYAYHSGGGRGLFLCEMFTKDPNPPPKLDIFNLTPSSKDKDSSKVPTPDNNIPPGEDE